MIRETLRNEVYDLAIALDFSHDPQQLGVQQFTALGLDQRGPHDDIDDAGLVFKRDKHHAGGRAGPLTTDHQTGDAHPGARLGLSNLSGSGALTA